MPLKKYTCDNCGIKFKRWSSLMLNSKHAYHNKRCANEGRVKLEKGKKI